MQKSRVLTLVLLCLVTIALSFVSARPSLATPAVAAPSHDPLAAGDYEATIDADITMEITATGEEGNYTFIAKYKGEQKDAGTITKVSGATYVIRGQKGWGLLFKTETGFTTVVMQGTNPGLSREWIPANNNIKS